MSLYEIKINYPEPGVHVGIARWLSQTRPVRGHSLQFACQRRAMILHFAGTPSRECCSSSGLPGFGPVPCGGPRPSASDPVPRISAATKWTRRDCCHCRRQCSCCFWPSLSWLRLRDLIACSSSSSSSNQCCCHCCCVLMISPLILQATTQGLV